ncbi:MAG: hypothetical protein RL497_3098 [Pseudomonadota bacterium]
MNMYTLSSTHDRLSFFKTDRFNNYCYLAVFALLSILLILPLWTITYLPLGDLPDHAGQLHAILNYSEYQRDYRINWFTPYLVGYSISLFFGLFFSATTALKITYTLSVLAIPVATASLARALGLNKFWIIPCFATAYSFAFFWGFFSFVVATPMTIAFFTFCVIYSQRPRDAKMFALAALFSTLLFFAHAMAWAFAMVIAASIIFINNNIKNTKQKLLPFVVLLPLVFYWVSVNGAAQAVQTSSVEFGNYLGHVFTRLSSELSYITGQFNERTTKGEHGQRAAEMLGFSIGRAPYSDFVAITLLLLAWPYMVGAKLTRNWKRWLPFLGVVGLYMVVPYWIFDTAYVNTRFAAFLLPLSLFLFEVNTSKSIFQRYGLIKGSFRCILGVAVTALVLVGNYAIFASFKKNDQDFKAILEKMEPKKTVLALMINQESKLTFSPPYMHYGSYYQAEKGGVVAPNFSHDPSAHNVPLRFRGTPWVVPDTWLPDNFDWVKHEGARYDYFLVRSDKLKDYLFVGGGGRVVLEARQGSWLLYKNNKIVEPIAPVDATLQPIP